MSRGTGARARHYLETKVVGGIARSLDDLPPRIVKGLRRDGNLRIRTVSDPGNPDGHVLFLHAFGDEIFPSSELWEASMQLSAGNVAMHVEKLRDVWIKTVVAMTEKVGLDHHEPFVESWNFANRPDLLERVGPQLAVAGDRLFKLLFRSAEDRARDAIGLRLEEAARERTLVLSVYSDNCFVPWGMLYTSPDATPLEPDGSNWKVEGFWGARHIVEHRTKVEHDGWIIPHRDGKLTVAFNVDVHLDHPSIGKPVTSTRKYFAAMRDVTVIERTERKSLEQALAKGSFDEQISYFLCHGHVSGSMAKPNHEFPTLALSDVPEWPIGVDDIEAWLQSSQLDSHPLIFLNACEAGQAKSAGYAGFATVLLKKKAAGVIGPQIDVPTVVAHELARRFFRSFIKGASGKTAGTALRDAVHSLLMQHCNPLGLAYTLYRGVDLRVVR